jgi:hypothetical protein
VLEFRAADGSPATIFDPNPQLFMDGVPVAGDVMHTADPTGGEFANPLNPGGIGQALAADLGEGRIWVSFEDQLFGSDDDDFNDAIVTIEPVDGSPATLAEDFEGETPGLADILAGIVTDPPAVERVPQVTPADVDGGGALSLVALFEGGGAAPAGAAAGGPAPLPVVTTPVDDPATAA